MFSGSSCQYVKYVAGSASSSSSGLELSFEYVSGEAVAAAAALGVAVGVCAVLLVLFFLAGRHYVRFRGCCTQDASKRPPGCGDVGVAPVSPQPEPETHAEAGRGRRRRPRAKCCLYGRRELSQADLASTESEIQ